MKNKFSEKKIKLKIPPISLLLFLFPFLFERGIFAVTALGAALIHELGHIFAASLCRVSITEITLYPFGADIRLSSPLRSYKKDVIISVAGAVVNLIAAFFSFFLPDGELREWIVASNVVLAVTNLLPIKGLDGGGIFYALMSGIFSPEKAEKSLRGLSFLGIFLMWAASVYIFFVANGNPSLFVVACGLFYTVFVRG